MCGYYMYYDMFWLRKHLAFLNFRCLYAGNYLTFLQVLVFLESLSNLYGEIFTVRVYLMFKETGRGLEPKEHHPRGETLMLD